MDIGWGSRKLKRFLPSWLNERGNVFFLYILLAGWSVLVTPLLTPPIYANTPRWLIVSGVPFRVSSKRGNVIPDLLSLRGMPYRVSSLRRKCYSSLTQSDGNAIPSLAQWEGNLTPRWHNLRGWEFRISSLRWKMLLQVESVWGCHSELAQYKGVSFCADLVYVEFQPDFPTPIQNAQLTLNEPSGTLSKHRI